MNILKIIGSLNTESNTVPKYIELIERMSELVHFALVKLSAPGCSLPALLTTAINYSIYDLGDESYYLAIPVMYVFDENQLF